jgi:GT2 family glycosyltransferase
LNPNALAFITCVNDETQYDTCIRHLDALQIPAGHTVETIAVFGAPSMAEGYQRAMEASTARYKIYVHQDVYIVHRELLPKLVTLFRTHSRLGMVGVVGATRLTASGIWWLNNASHSYGRIWEYSRPGGFWSWLGPFNRRRLHLIRYRSFVGDYLPAAVVDGLFLATQYDLPWISPLGGFELYEQVHGLEFIKAGLEIGIARQETVWCLHWGPLLEFSSHQRRHRDLSFHHRVAAFQQHFHTFIGVPARRLNKQDWGTPQLSDQNGPKFCDGVTDRGTMAQDSKSPAAGTERLGVVIVTYNGRDLLLRALRALLPQFEALKDVEYRVVAVDNASTGGTIEAVRGESPRITVLADASNGGAARAFNAGLRELSFPSYVLVMHDDAEFSAGSLAGMVGYLREHPSAAGVVASLMNPDGTVQPQRMAIVELMPQRPQRPRRVTFVGTTCALFRGEVFFDVGLYDERFSYHEDLDWSLRAKRKGYKFVYLPEAKAVHHRDGGVGRREPDFTDRSVATLWLVYKHAGRRWAGLLYWMQRIRSRWLVRRWRHDGVVLRQINEARVQAESLYHRFCEENRRPQLL